MINDFTRSQSDQEHAQSTLFFLIPLWYERYLTKQIIAPVKSNLRKVINLSSKEISNPTPKEIFIQNNLISNETATATLLRCNRYYHKPFSLWLSGPWHPCGPLPQARKLYGTIEFVSEPTSFPFPSHGTCLLYPHYSFYS